MDGMKDYLKWRGDISFLQVPVTPVDGLIFSAISYVDFRGFVPEEPTGFVPLGEVIERLLEEEDLSEKVRVKQDIALMKAALETLRFTQCKIGFYREELMLEEEGQFAAVTFLLPDGSAFLTFRGTDKSVVGWKEDLNMGFCDEIPAQKYALEYLQEYAAVSENILRIGGHSKGGNISVYAAAKVNEELQHRIYGIYNYDGPGFTEDFMAHDGYWRIVPRIHTYIPQSSIIGMLLDHQESYSVIKSRNPGILQHEIHSWEVLGGDFIHLQEISAGNQFMNQAIKKWLMDMSRQDRETFVDTLYEMIKSEKVTQVGDLLKPSNIGRFFKQLESEESKRKIVFEEIAGFIRTAREVRKGLDEEEGNEEDGKQGICDISCNS